MEENAMSEIQKLVTIGGSAGSLQALFRILEGLDTSYDTPILLVVHRVTSADSTLVDLLVAKTHLRVAEIEEKEPIRKGHLYICPADYHVLVEEDNTFSLDVSEKVNFSRPSLDVVFKSAAEVFKVNLIAVLLSGANADGASGLESVKECGGIAVVQDPLEAQVPYMPQQALKQIVPDHVLTCDKIAELLNSKF